MKLRSSISPALTRSAIFRGTFIAGLGALLLLISGSSFSLGTLNRWGFLFWAAGFALIAYGLLPYKNFARLSTKPNEIIFDENNCIHYISREKLFLSIPIKDIKSIKYKEIGLHYGICLNLYQSRKQQTIFLPFFSKLSYEKMQKYLDQENSWG